MREARETHIVGSTPPGPSMPPSEPYPRDAVPGRVPTPQPAALSGPSSGFARARRFPGLAGSWLVVILGMAMTVLACGADSEEAGAQDAATTAKSSSAPSSAESEGSKTPQPTESGADETVSARERLAEAQQQLKSVVRKVEAKQQAFERAQDELATARNELAKAQDELQEVSWEVDDRETNVALFRVVQRALLENELIDDVAIRVDVSHGVVTLHGKVETEAQKREALETARSAAGIFDVDSEIEILGSRTDSEGSEGSS